MSTTIVENTTTLPDEAATLQEWIGNAGPDGPQAIADRRSYAGAVPGVERRQFSNSHDGLSPPAKELAIAIDQYKMTHRRRFITYEEMLQVVLSLGYSKS
jgi:hypothetical protein